MTSLQAIQSATLHAARLLGEEAHLGAIAPGKAADIVAVRGDPLKDVALLKAIDFVMKDGVVYKRAGEGAVRLIRAGN